MMSHPLDPRTRGHWMMTYTGRAYWPTSPSPDDVSIIDIAHHLAMLCRYTGATRFFYSVAEHSVHVSRMVAPEFALCGLLHDAPEAYLNDINRPVKHGIDLDGYRRLEEINWRVIAMKFGLPLVEPEEVKRADNDILFHERADVLPYDIPPALEWGMGLDEPAKIVHVVEFWPWQKAEYEFLKRFEELTGEKA